MQPQQTAGNRGREETMDTRARSKNETASERVARRKHNFLRMINKNRSRDTPLRPKPKLRFPKLAWKDGTAYGDPSDTYPPLGRLEPSLLAGSKEWHVCYLGSIPNCSEWRSYRTRSAFLEHVDWAKRHGYLMCRSLSQKILMLSGTWLQVADRRKKLLYVLNGIAQISSVSCCEYSVEEEDLLLGIKCLHPLRSMVQCHVLVVESKKSMAEICDELQQSFEILARDREKMAEQVQSAGESYARLQSQGLRALTVRQPTDGAMEGVEIESRHAFSEQLMPRFRTDTGQATQMEGSRIISLASSDVGSLQPPIQIKKFEIHQLEESTQSAQVPKRLQTLVKSNTAQPNQAISPENGIIHPSELEGYRSSLDPVPPSAPDVETAVPDKPVARRIKKIISRLDLPEEQPASDVTKLDPPPPPPPKRIWQDGEEDELPPVVRRPRRRQLDDPVEEKPARPSSPKGDGVHASPVVVAAEAHVPQVPVSRAPDLSETERELRHQQLELDIALRELQALNLGIELPITHVDDVTAKTDSNPITSVDKQLAKSGKKKFSGLRSLIPPPPPDIPPELMETPDPSSEEASLRGDVETPEQESAQELRRRFDPNPDKKLALISEIKKGANLRKVSGDHPDQRARQDPADFRSVLTEIKQGGSKQRLRRVPQASQNRLAQSQKGRAVGELGAKLAERRLATDSADPAVYRAQRERQADRFARVNTGINPQTDLNAEPADYLPPWKRQLLESRERKRLEAIRDKEESERLREEQMKDIPVWKRKLIEKKVALRDREDKKEAVEKARLEARIRKFENMPEWKKEVLRKHGKVDVIETSDSDTGPD